MFYSTVPSIKFVDYGERNSKWLITKVSNSGTLLGFQNKKSCCPRLASAAASNHFQYEIFMYWSGEHVFLDDGGVDERDPKNCLMSLTE